MREGGAVVAAFRYFTGTLPSNTWVSNTVILSFGSISLLYYGLTAFKLEMVVSGMRIALVGY